MVVRQVAERKFRVRAGTIRSTLFNKATCQRLLQHIKFRFDWHSFGFDFPMGLKAWQKGKD